MDDHSLMGFTTALTEEAIKAQILQSGDKIQEFLRTTFTTLSTLHQGAATPAAATPQEPQEPAVSIKKSVTPDAIICLEDGLAFKSLKRHIGTKYGLSPEEYRRKWRLPADYPMVAPNYSAKRSELAKETGLGRRDPAPPVKVKGRRVA